MNSNLWMYKEGSLKAKEIPYHVFDIAHNKKRNFKPDINYLISKIQKSYELAIGSYLYNIDFEESELSKDALKSNAFIYLTSEYYKKSREYELYNVKKWMKSNAYEARGTQWDSASIEHQEFSCIEIARWLKFNRIETDCEFLKEQE